jgi:hypothetical protein
MGYSQMICVIIATKKMNDEQQERRIGPFEDDLFYKSYGKPLLPVRICGWLLNAKTRLLP